MNRRKLIFPILVMATGILACSLTSGAVKQAPAATSVDTAMAPTATTATATQAPPTVVSQPTQTNVDTQIPPTQAATQAPTLSAQSTAGLALPKAVLMDQWDGIGVSMMDASGKPITEIRMASDFESTTNALHVGGRMPAGAIQIPLIFYSFTDSGSLKVDLNAVDTNIRSVSTFLGLAGAAGKPIVAYSEIVGGGSSPYTSQILVGSPDSLPTAVPILTRDASDAVVLYPLAVAANGDQAAGVWYTRTPNGIGDATFPVYQGLSYYDIAGQKSSEVLTEDQNPAGMSPDLTWAAFTVAPGHGSDQGAALNLIDLASKQTTTLPIDPSSVLGSGYAVFSPDNQYVAWMEASGSAPEAVKTEIRIARVDGSGTPVTVDAAALASVTGGWPVLWEKPVGWLDNDTLLVQLEGDGRPQKAVARVKADGSGVALFQFGDFVEFIYP